MAGSGPRGDGFASYIKDAVHLRPMPASCPSGALLNILFRGANGLPDAWNDAGKPFVPLLFTREARVAAVP